MEKVSGEVKPCQLSPIPLVYLHTNKNRYYESSGFFMLCQHFVNYSAYAEFLACISIPLDCVSMPTILQLFEVEAC